MQKLLTRLTALDWILSGATLAYGLWSKNPLIIGVGAVGLLIAWYSPAKRLQTKMANSSLASRRRAKESAAAQAAIEAVAEEEAAKSTLGAEPVATSELPPRNFSSQISAYAGMRLTPSKHNRLQPSSFNLYNNNNTGFN